MFFSTEANFRTASVLHRSRFNLLQGAEIWYTKNSKASCENIIRLSDEFYAELSSHPIPTDLEAVQFTLRWGAAASLFTKEIPVIALTLWPWSAIASRRSVRAVTTTTLSRSSYHG